MTESEARILFARQGYKLWRNNSGVLRDDTGRPVRYGLANDSKALNATIKSSDLIGWFPMVVTSDMVGRTFARFVSVECKPSGWHLTPGDERGQAQQRWLDLVNADGGIGLFQT